MGKNSYEMCFFNFWRDYKEYLDYLPGSIYLLHSLYFFTNLIGGGEQTFVSILKIFNFLADIGFAICIFYYETLFECDKKKFFILCFICFCNAFNMVCWRSMRQMDTFVVLMALMSILTLLYIQDKNVSKKY